MTAAEIEFDRCAAKERAARVTAIAVQRLRDLTATPPKRIVYRKGRRPLSGCEDRAPAIERIIGSAVAEGADRDEVIRRWRGVTPPANFARRDS